MVLLCFGFTHHASQCFFQCFFGLQNYFVCLGLLKGVPPFFPEVLLVFVAVWIYWA